MKRTRPDWTIIRLLLLLLGAYHGCDDPGFPEHQSAVFKQNQQDKCYTMVFIAINALHVSGGSSTHHQELKIVYTASGICRDFSASHRYHE